MLLLASNGMDRARHYISVTTIILDTFCYLLERFLVEEVLVAAVHEARHDGKQRHHRRPTQYEADEAAGEVIRRTGGNARGGGAEQAVGLNERVLVGVANAGAGGVTKHVPRANLEIAGKNDTRKAAVHL